MSATEVWPTSIGKRDGDNGKRWEAWCRDCGWRTLWRWVGGQRMAQAAARAHHC